MIKKILQWLLLVAIMVMLFYNPIRIKKDISEHTKYSICTIFKESSSLKNGEHYHYYFYYLGNKIERYNSKNRNYKVQFGNRFLVKFSYKDPDHSKIMYDYPISDSIESPTNGWDSIPFFIKQKIQNNGF